MLPLAFVERDWQHYSSVESGIDRQVCQRGRVVIEEKIATVTGILHDAAKAPDLRPLGPRGEDSRGIRLQAFEGDARKSLLYVSFFVQSVIKILHSSVG
jgi:hypothetical protein